MRGERVGVGHVDAVQDRVGVVRIAEAGDDGWAARRKRISQHVARWGHELIAGEEQSRGDRVVERHCGGVELWTVVGLWMVADVRQLLRGERVGIADVGGVQGGAQAGGNTDG
jgi:hypothetical protein